MNRNSLKRLSILLLFLYSFWGCDLQNNKTSSFLTIDQLKCEHTKAPINIDKGNPLFSWFVSSKIEGQKQKAYRILVALNKDFSDLQWDSGKIEGNSVNQAVYSGKELKSNSDYYWKLNVWDQDDRMSESKTAGFSTSICDPEEWKAAWIGAKTNEPVLLKGFLKDVKEQASLKDTIRHEGRSLLLRNEFACNSEIKRARVFVTGLGYYELYLNGKRVGDQVLSPAKTNYAKEILYDTYDVKDDLKKGKNTFGIHLGNGWYNPYKKWWQEYRMQWFGSKRAILELHITYENGKTEIIRTGNDWKYKQGPVLYNCIYDGEYYDARQEIEGWNSENFDDSDWDPVQILNTPKAVLRSQVLPPTRVVQTIDPVKIYRPKSGVRVYDMGQNFAGWVRVTVRGKRGTKLHLRFAEDIHKDGSIDVTSNENARAEVTYILKGGEAETYEPRFTFFGFRYVEVTAGTDLPEISEVEACVVHSDNTPSGFFDCGNETINKIHKATVWSQKSNMIGFPMDCPQRDERLGWLGDAQVTAEEGMFNFDMALFYENWITGIRKNQDPESGDIPIISPRPYIKDEGVEWSSTYINMIWKYYVYYGDQRILKDNYQAMKRYGKYLDSQADGYILKQGWIGDWGSLVKGWEEGEPESVPTAFYYWNSRILSKAAAVLGLDEDQKSFFKKAAKIREAYNKRFFDTKKNRYNKGSQMANAFPLYLGIVPDQHKDTVLQNLINDILIKNHGHLTTGVLGSKYMIDALSSNGRADIAYLLATQTGYPSWSDMVQKYTTMCEFWTLKQSHNHVMTGSIDAFFNKVLAGIEPNEKYPGFERVNIRPFIPNGLPYVKASVKTVRGKVEVDWQNSKRELKMKVAIPFNMTADIYVPVYQKDGDLLKDDSGLAPVDISDNYIHFVSGAGIFKFSVTHKAVK